MPTSEEAGALLGARRPVRDPEDSDRSRSPIREKRGRAVTAYRDHTPRSPCGGVAPPRACVRPSPGVVLGGAFTPLAWRDGRRVQSGVYGFVGTGSRPTVRFLQGDQRAG